MNLQKLPFPSGALLALTALLVSAQSSGTPRLPLAGKQAKTVAVETPLPAMTWKDVKGTGYAQTLFVQKKATVFLFSSTQCPIANLYTPRLIELARTYTPRGVQFFLVNSNQEDSLATVRKYAADRQFPFPAIKDEGVKLADYLNADRTPEAVIVDSKGIVRYRGRIDDNADRTKIIRQDVREALNAMLAGKAVERGRTLAFGCSIFRDTVAPKTTLAASVTYSRDIAPILFKNCVSCHREGEVGPFSLTTYQQARVWSAAIKDYTARRAMPPWKAVAGIGDFHDARVLTDDDIARIAKWVDSGAVQGNPKETPALPTFPTDGWRLPVTPNRTILASNQPYSLHADGKDVYRQFILPVATSENRYLNAIEFKPDCRAVVHHMIVFFDTSGISEKLDQADPGPGYSVENGGGGIGVPFDKSIWVAGWAPGNTPRFLPEGMAFRLPKGAKVVLQVHYHPNGQSQQDKSQVALHFVDEAKVEKVVFTDSAINPYIRFKPGVERQKVTAASVLRMDTELVAVLPHMHMLGREMKLTAKLPDGTAKPLIYINDWDFNWQETYALRELLKLPKGTRIELEAFYDNSEKNPRQPSHPPVEVTWGEQTTDEMCIGFYQFTVPRKLLEQNGLRRSARKASD